MFFCSNFWDWVMAKFSKPFNSHQKFQSRFFWWGMRKLDKRNFLTFEILMVNAMPYKQCFQDIELWITWLVQQY